MEMGQHLKRNIKRVMIVGSMVVAMSFGGNTWASKSVGASPVAKLTASTASSSAAAPATVAKRDDLLEALNQPSDEELYDALYEGQSLADVATVNGADAQRVIDLQVGQLNRQLDQRLASGSITREQYEAYRAEVPDIIRSSVNSA